MGRVTVLLSAGAFLPMRRSITLPASERVSMLKLRNFFRFLISAYRAGTALAARRAFCCLLRYRPITKGMGRVTVLLSAGAFLPMGGGITLPFTEGVGM